MQRRSFIGRTLGSGMSLRSRAAALQVPLRHIEQQAEVFIERDQPGLPHKGKVLAAIQPHNDDVPLFAAGTVLKLIREGYTGILIRTTDDEAAGRKEAALWNRMLAALLAHSMGCFPARFYTSSRRRSSFRRGGRQIGRLRRWTRC